MEKQSSSTMLTVVYLTDAFFQYLKPHMEVELEVTFVFKKNKNKNHISYMSASSTPNFKREMKVEGMILRESCTGGRKCQIALHICVVSCAAK